MKKRILFFGVLLTCFLIGISSRIYRSYKIATLKNSANRTVVPARILSCNKGWRTSVLWIKYKYIVKGEEVIEERTFKGSHNVDFCSCLLQSRTFSAIVDTNNIKTSFLLLKDEEFQEWGIEKPLNMCK